MRRQFSPDCMGRASYPVVGDKGKLEAASSGRCIRLFSARQGELFHEDSRFIDTDRFGCSPNAYADRLSSIDERPYARIIEPTERVR